MKVNERNELTKSSLHFYTFFFWFLAILTNALKKTDQGSALIEMRGRCYKARGPVTQFNVTPKRAEIGDGFESSSTLKD